MKSAYFERQRHGFHSLYPFFENSKWVDKDHIEVGCTSSILPAIADGFAEGLNLFINSKVRNGFWINSHFFVSCRCALKKGLSLMSSPVMSIILAVGIILRTSIANATPSIFGILISATTAANSSGEDCLNLSNATKGS